MRKLLSCLAGIFLGSQCLAAIIPYGAGSISDTINPNSYGCVIDNGNWIFNAGVVEPGVAGCDTGGDYNGVPVGAPVKLYPQLAGDAAARHTGTHRWWGSVSFFGEMRGDGVAYITPDPIMARVSERGLRVLGIPNGLRVPNENEFVYQIPDPMAEVFDGIAVGNSQFSNLDAYMKDYSDGSVTIEWRSGSTPVMEATLVYGSPYIFFEVFNGTAELRTKAVTGPEKGVFYNSGNQLGVWTDVAGQRNHYLLVGDGATSFSNPDAMETAINNSSHRFTLVWLPVSGSQSPTTAMIDDFAQYALNRIDEVRIDYDVDSQTQNVTVTQRYLGGNNVPVTTLAGLMPLQWKNTTHALGAYQTRSSRGVVRFTPSSEVSYQLPYVGVLPTLPTALANLDQNLLRNLINEFISQGAANWNTALDTYWSGKNYGKVAELAAIARSIGMTAEADQLVNWLKGELQDWFTANTSGSFDHTKYFVYDSDWNTLLGFDESFGAHQQLNDHHFHYGYFVRAAVEICRVDRSWCGDNAYGPMVELLIRDYAGGRDDSMFPYLRNFDPANGFSWASGHANFALGNNNESTSEAANAYGAIILYGLLTDDQAMVERGIYLHASSTAAYWEYWNNLDAYRGLGPDYDNFPEGYSKMTTSIIWGAGGVFSTWFSPAYAHILGIQGLPLNPMVLHIGQHADYLEDYVTLGLSESANGQPSGLPAGQWTDIWWNILAMTDPQRAINDFNSVNLNYTPEEGETKAHTYQWIHVFDAIGSVASGSGEYMSDYPAAAAFEKNGVITYLAYNMDNSVRHVTFSDGMAINVAPNSFGIKRTGDTPDSESGGEDDTQAPTVPGTPTVSEVTGTGAGVSWVASTDNVAVSGYEVAVGSNIFTTSATQYSLSGLLPDTQYTVSVRAFDAAGNYSAAASAGFTTQAQSCDNCNADYGASTLNTDSALFFVNTNGFADLHYHLNGGPQLNVAMSAANGRKEYIVSSLNDDDVIDYWFTYQNPETGLAQDTSEFVYTHNGDGSGELPAHWSANDIGSPVPGAVEHNNSVFTTSANGSDIWGTSDNFYFVYQTLTGDGQITARVQSLEVTDAWAKAGVMMRASLNANSRHVLMAISGSNGSAFQHRVSDAESSSHTAGPVATAPYRVRLQREGDVFTASVSADGVNWTMVGSATIAMPDTIYVGLAHTSHSDGVLGSASFSDVQVDTFDLADALWIEAEDYAAYADSDAGNNGGAYRSDDVDIEASTDTNGGFNVGWTQAGEWLEYPVELLAGQYRICSRVASDTGGGQFSLSLNGQQVAQHSVANTGGWQSWVTVRSALFATQAGARTLRVDVQGGNFNLNWLELTTRECTTL